MTEGPPDAAPARAHEIRVDPLTGLRVIIAPGGSFDTAVAAAAGSEDGDEPLLQVHAPEPERSHRPDLFAATAATGVSEIIANAQGGAALAHLDDTQVTTTVDAWRARMRAHADRAYVHLHADVMVAGAAAAGHARLQAMAFVPALVARERERFGAYATRTLGGNLLSDLLQEEVRQRVRIVAIDDDAVLLTPFASASPYRLMVVPRRGRTRFEDEAGPSGAALLRDALRRLSRRFGACPPLTLWVRTAPRGAEHFCWHLDIVPRFRAPDGLELATGVPVNGVSPEQAADELRHA